MAILSPTQPYPLFHTPLQATLYKPRFYCQIREAFIKAMITAGCQKEVPMDTFILVRDALLRTVPLK